VVTPVQFRKKGAPHVEPYVFFLPLFEPAPTGRSAGILARDIAPARAGFENPENAFEHAAIVSPRPAATFVFGEQRRDALPLFLREKWLWHPQLFTKLRAKYKVKITGKRLMKPLLVPVSVPSGKKFRLNEERARRVRNAS